MKNEVTNQSGIYGWRKRCLYCLILLLVVLILVNFALTAWILVVLQFNMDGMGNIRITASGIQVQGEAEFLNAIYAGNITTHQSTPLNIHAHKNVTIEANDSKLEITPLDIRVKSENFAVEFNKRSDTVLSVSEQGNVTIKSSVIVDGEQGIYVTNYVTTSLIASQHRKNLNIKSPNENIFIETEDLLLLESKFHSIELLTGGDIILNSSKVEVSAGSILLSNLPMSSPVGSNSKGRLWNEVYYLCICPSGKLYRVPANVTSGCNVDNESLVCQ